MLEGKFELAVETYRTSKLRNLENKFSIEFNPEDKKESTTDIKLKYKSDQLSFDKLMYKVTGLAISGEKLDINELDSIYNSFLINDDLQTEYAIIVYSIEADSVIAQTADINRLKYQRFTDRKEIDNQREAQVYFSSPVRFIFQKMFFYIALSGLMLIAVVVALVYQLKIIFKQKKIEQIRQDFTDSVVHELRNPLQSALSMTELVENETFSQNAKRRNEVIGRIKGNLT